MVNLLIMAIDSCTGVLYNSAKRTVCQCKPMLVFACKRVGQYTQGVCIALEMGQVCPLGFRNAALEIAAVAIGKITGDSGLARMPKRRVP